MIHFMPARARRRAIARHARARARRAAAAIARDLAVVRRGVRRDMGELRGKARSR
jgi:hypothetical protein